MCNERQCIDWCSLCPGRLTNTWFAEQKKDLIKTYKYITMWEKFEASTKHDQMLLQYFTQYFIQVCFMYLSWVFKKWDRRNSPFILIWEQTTQRNIAKMLFVIIDDHPCQESKTEQDSEEDVGQHSQGVLLKSFRPRGLISAGVVWKEINYQKIKKAEWLGYGFLVKICP